MKMSSIKLIVSDLDGTLLSKNGLISQRNMEAILKLKQAGILFSMASGRTDSMFKEYARQLKIDIPVIASSGAIIRNPFTRETLYKRVIGINEALEAMNYFRENRMDYMAYTEDKVYFTDYSQRIAKFLRYNEIAMAGGTELVNIDFYLNNHEEIAKEGVVKILLCGIREGDIDKASNIVKNISGLECVKSEANALDIVSEGVSKGDALRRLAYITGVSLSEVCVFGDYVNDISMMETAGFSVAMGNAQDSVKRTADIITDTNDNDGIAKVIEEYIM